MRISKLLRGSRQGPETVAADVDDEIRSHLEERVRHLVDRGMTPDAARAEAMRRFGDMEGTRRAMRQSAERHEERRRWRDRFDAAAQDLRYAFRQLKHTPGFTAGVALTFALGIGANATMFGVVDRLLLRPPAHVREPDRLGRIYLNLPVESGQSVERTEVSYLRFTELRDAVATNVDLAALSAPSAITVGSAAEARRVQGSFATANVWPLLGVRPALGRFFGAEEDRPPDGSTVAVLGFTHWRTAYGADSSVIGRQIDVGARRYTIVGVAPAGFNGVGLAPVDLWLPATTVRTDLGFLQPDWYTKHSLQWLQLVGRLRPGVTPAQATAALSGAFSRSIAAEAPNEPRLAEYRASFGPLLEERGPLQSTGARVATLLAAVAVIVLLVACANVANLLLARALRRRREIAVRVALGVGRARLVTQLLLESLLLAGTGALLGLVLARAGGRVMQTVLLPNVAWDEAVIDTRVFAFTAGATVIAGILAGLAPALYATRPDLAFMLKGSAREGTHPRSRLRNVLLLAQAALCTMLLVGAGLFVKSLRNAQQVDLGLDTDRLLSVNVELRGAAAPEGGRAELYRRFAERLRGFPGVTHATTTMAIPFSMSGSTDLDVPGVDSIGRFGQILLNGVGTGYFETVGTRILRGRALGPEDRKGSPLVMVVSDSMARALWPRQDALGKCVKVGGKDRPCSTVVGIAENVAQDDVRGERYLQYWFPESQNQGDNGGAFATLVRVAGEPDAMSSAIREALQPIVPGNAYLDVRPLALAVERVVRPWRMGATMFGVFGLLGLAIAAMGLYSLLAYAVSQRAQELSVRIALGASAGDVLRLVMSQGLRVTMIGIAVGLAAALVASRWVRELLFGVRPTDPIVLVSVVGTLLAAAVVASLVPAWRASSVDPSSALRAE